MSELDRLTFDNEILKESRRWKRECIGWIAVAVLALVAIVVMFFGHRLGMDKEWQSWSRTALTSIVTGVLAFIGGKGSKADRPGT